MSDLSIRVEGLSKQYRIGTKAEPYFTLRDSLSQMGSRVLRSFSRNGHKNQAQSLFWALQDVSFEVRQGEVIGIIGPNGAGKTTLLKILSRITAPTRGRAEIRGRVAAMLEVGTGLHPELTGRENIYLSGAILGMRKAEIERNFDEIVAFAGVERFLETPLKRYSSGMHLRLAFAVAAHLEPEIVLVDEVLAVGDAEFQKKCLGKMGDIGRQGRTVLLVSHNMGAINSLCKRSLLLRHGSTVLDGDTADVIPAYLESAHERGGEVAWGDVHSAPGNHRIRLRSVQILSEDGRVRHEFGVNENIFIRIRYQNLKEGQKLHVFVFLKDETGSVVMQSANVPSENLGVDEWYDRPRPPGIFQTVCRIPPDLLNVERTYIVDVHALDEMRGKGDFYEENALSFKVLDSGTRAHHGTWAGVVRPRLTWSTEFLGPADSD